MDSTGWLLPYHTRFIISISAGIYPPPFTNWKGGLLCDGVGNYPFGVRKEITEQMSMSHGQGWKGV